MEQLIKILDTQLIFLNIDVSTKTEVIQRMAEQMCRLGFVKESYSEAVLKREESFPTGLQTTSLGIAIPHTDAEHVNKETVAVAVLKSPVLFNMMGMDDQEIGVDIIFMIAIKEPHGQLRILQELTGLIQNAECLQKLKLAETEDEVISILKTAEI
ncbi:MAG: PTS sugar transporter subunit IIA [Bacilli bacterium]